MKEKLDVIRIAAIGNFLKDVDRRYLLTQIKEDAFLIEEDPHVYLGNLKDLYDCLCYDMEDLSSFDRQKYQGMSEAFIKGENNIYRRNVKQYIFKNDLHNKKKN